MVKKCKVLICDRDKKAKGYCGYHYRLDRLGKDVNVMPRFMSPRGEWGQWFHSGSGYLIRQRKRADGSAEHQMQHRVIMSDHLGRELLEHENVHHINGIRDDNRIENLELWTRSQPTGSRVADKTAWAIEWLKGQGYEISGP